MTEQRDLLTCNEPGLNGLDCDEDLNFDDSGSDEFASKSGKSCDQYSWLATVFPRSPNSDPNKQLFTVLNEKSAHYTPDPFIFQNNRQPDLTWRMRALLIDWMLEVSAEFDLRRETFYLAYNYLDRFINKVSNIQRADFQLVGTSALYLACKTEEIFAPKIELFRAATDHGYTKDQILEIERRM